MPSASEILNQFYKGTDFAEDSVSAIIEDVHVEELPNRQGDPAPKLVVTLFNHRRKVVLNKTSGNALIEKWGDDYARWIGETIVLRGVPMLVGGKLIPVIVATPSTVKLQKEAE